MKIGCSLPFKLFTCPTENDACLALLESGGGRIESLLAGILSAGAESVELRSVGIDTNPDDLLAAYKDCMSAGLATTLHGSTPRDDLSKTDFFAPYQKLFEEVGQNRLTVTLHALAEPVGTAKTLDFLTNCAKENGYPVKIVLENSRKKLHGDTANSCEGVNKILRLASNKDIGICWDYGHYYFNLTHFSGDFDSLPPEEFLSNVRHTHIHSIYDERTHFPLGIGEIPLQRYCNALNSRGYRGLFNPELDFTCFYAEMNPYKQLIKSINILKEAISHVCRRKKRRN